jgi:hypothetical protein
MMIRILVEAVANILGRNAMEVKRKQEAIGTLIEENLLLYLVQAYQAPTYF